MVLEAEIHEMRSKSEVPGFVHASYPSYYVTHYSNSWSSLLSLHLCRDTTTIAVYTEPDNIQISHHLWS